MTINLPNDLESSIQATVRNGRFASVDERWPRPPACCSAS